MEKRCFESNPSKSFLALSSHIIHSLGGEYLTILFLEPEWALSPPIAHDAEDRIGY